MLRFTKLLILASLLALACKEMPAAAQAKPQRGEIRYLAFQIFTSSPDPKRAVSSEGLQPLGSLPDKSALRPYVDDIKGRIGTVGAPNTRLAVIFGPISFDHTDAEVTQFIDMAFRLALETDVAVGFHLDDSMFWAKRKDLWSDPKNVEAMDWDGTPSTGRRLDWGRKPSEAPPQMCFNSKAILREVQQRSTLIGKAIQAGVKQLQQRNRPELFAGVIAGWETMIGQDFQTNKYLGYRALLNRGFSRQHPPQDMDGEREKVVQEFIEHWTDGLAEAGVSPQKIYSHTAFLSHRTFQSGDNAANSYAQHNHFAPPSVAFGKTHRPGFSTYPQPGLYDDIYAELAAHRQTTGWASSEGTNLELGSAPGQSGMNMETYLAKMFNHGATLVDIFSWGVGGEANKNMDFRVVTEGPEALEAYRKFLKGAPLTEAPIEAQTLMERLPAKIHRIQKELPAWIEKGGDKTKAMPLMQKLDASLKANQFEEAEKTADAILELIGASASPAAAKIPEEVRRVLRHEFGFSFLVYRDKVQDELKLTPEQRAKLDTRLQEMLPEIMQFFQKIGELKPEERETQLAAYRPQARAKLDPALQKILTAGQRTRLRQLELQREGLFGGPENWTNLNITDEQRQQFVAVSQQAQQKIAPLLQEAKSTGNPNAVRPKVLQIRTDLEAQLESLLTDAQKKQWKEMLGKPMDINALFDM